MNNELSLVFDKLTNRWAWWTYWSLADVYVHVVMYAIRQCLL